MKEIEKKQGGFTIIEVVLVLAIAGLIFMVVFLALPGLQRSQRDTQRKQDVGRFFSMVTTYQGNHKGELPCAGKATVTIDRTTPPTTYEGTCLGPLKVALLASGSSFKDPSFGEDYKITYITAANQASYALGEVYYGINARCNATDNHIVIDAANVAGSIAVATLLQDGMVYCQQG